MGKRQALAGSSAARHSMLEGHRCPSAPHHAEGCPKVPTHLLPTSGGRTDLQVAPKTAEEAALPRRVPQPRGAAGGSAPAAGRSICRDQTKNTAGRSFSSAAISRSLSHSSTARFKTPEGSALVSSFPTATSGKRQAERPRYFPGAPARRLQGNLKS